MRQRTCLGLILAALIVLPARAEPGAREISRYVWQDEDPRFGGFSALELSDDGARFFALSDRTWLARGTITRDADGKITDIQAGPLTTLKNTDGGALPALLGDSEGLALMPDGALCVSFEAVARIWCYDDPTGPARALPSPPGADEMLPNASLEALAVGPDGAFWTMPERSGKLTRPFPVLVLRAGVWSQEGALPREDEFLPVGADFGPDGAFYLLERRVGAFGGFASRIRRFHPGEEGLGPAETLWESPLWRHDNLEGLSVWQAPEGLRITMISDDNFNFFQRTELVELALEK